MKLVIDLGKSIEELAYGEKFDIPAPSITAMAYWLFKEEPEHYSFDDLMRDKGTRWDGVRNNLALRHLRSMKKNDLVLYYHTGSEKAAVGIAKVTSDWYQDPEEKDPKLVVIDIAPTEKLRRPVTLVEIKANPRFKSFELIRIPRLSVMPVPDTLWDEIIKMSKS
jgi:predicted RNA-binding protein with PUA-like domain